MKFAQWRISLAMAAVLVSMLGLVVALHGIVTGQQAAFLRRLRGVVWRFRDGDGVAREDTQPAQLTGATYRDAMDRTR